MRSPSHDIADFLAGEGVGVFAGNSASALSISRNIYVSLDESPANTCDWALNVSREPTAPDCVVTIYDAGGLEAFPNINLFTPRVQVRVRADVNGYPSAYSKQAEIRDILIQAKNILLGDGGDTRYLGFWLESDINSIGRDDNDRPILTANYRIQRQPIGE